MPTYTTADIKALREQTGAGMLDVKKALVDSDGDRDKAIELLRVKGLKGVTKREGRSASNGLVASHVDGGSGTLVEINCETDFVAKGETFQALAAQVLQVAVASGATDPAVLLAEQVEGRTVQALVEEAGATIGEKVEVRRVTKVEAAHVGSYLHRTSPDLPPQIGVLIGLDTGDAAADAADQVARDVAMHVAALSPTVLSRDDVAEEVVAAERRIAEETAREEGKPEQALPKIIEGRVKSYFKDNVLLEQMFAKDPKKSIEQVLADAGVTITGFARFRVGA